MERLTALVAALVVLFPVALAVSLYECYPTEPEPGEMVVCPMEELESPFGGEFGWAIHELTMIWDQPKVVWQAVHVVEVDGPSPDRATATARLVEFTERLLDELREEFGEIESGEIEIEKNEFVKRLIDEFREETGIEMGII